MRNGLARSAITTLQGPIMMGRAAWTRALARAADTPLLYAINTLSLSVTGHPTRLLDPGGFSYSTSRTRTRIDSSAFAPDPRLAVILTFGQSQMANEGAADGLFVPGPGVFNFNFFDGACYVAHDPLLGTTMDRSNFTTRLGDHLVRRAIYDRVLLVPIAHGATAISQWVPGADMFRRIAVAVRRLHDAGITVTHALWQQGETDAAYGAPAAAWMLHFNRMVTALRAMGMTAPIHVALSTRCCGPPNETIRAAQRGVVNAAANVLAGPDTDMVGPQYRWDDCHYSAEGLARVAELWFRSLTETATVSIAIESEPFTLPA
jgi:hypothetical protein